MSKLIIEAKELRDAIGHGVLSVASRLEQLTGERGNVPHPEYLTTTCVGFCLGNYFDERGLPVVIRFEVQTGVLWRMGEVRAWLSRRAGRAKEVVRKLRAKVSHEARRGTFNRHKGLRDANRKYRDADRPGNVDIVLFERGGIDHPFAIIENKGLLTFTVDEHLSSGGRFELDKDIRRNAHYVSNHSEINAVQFAAFTFYLHDKDSTDQLAACIYRVRKHQYFVAHLKGLGLDPRIRTNVVVDAWDSSSLPSNSQEARELDKVGQLERGHIAYGVICLYVDGDCIGDELDLASNLASPCRDIDPRIRIGQE